MGDTELTTKFTTVSVTAASYPKYPIFFTIIIGLWSPATYPSVTEQVTALKLVKSADLHSELANIILVSSEVKAVIEAFPLRSKVKSLEETV